MKAVFISTMWAIFKVLLLILLFFKFIFIAHLTDYIFYIIFIIAVCTKFFFWFCWYNETIQSFFLLILIDLMKVNKFKVKFLKTPAPVYNRPNISYKNILKNFTTSAVRPTVLFCKFCKFFLFLKNIKFKLNAFIYP